MNKKCMSKIGAISMLLVATISIITISLILLVSASTEKQYAPGEKIKIEIGDIGEYILTIKTPDQTLTEKSSKPYFIYQPIQEGKYSIEIKSDNHKEEIIFEIKDPANEPEEKIEEPQTPKPQTPEKTPTPQETQKEIRIENQPVVGEPYKWKKKFDDTSKLRSIKIPKASTNISVKGNPEIEFKVKDKLTDRISNTFSEVEEKSLIVANIEENFEVEYETPAPTKSEKIISKEKKEVEVTSLVHYENVLVETSLPEEIPKEKRSTIKVYWKEEGEYLDFKASDTNNNSLLDKIEWTAPHLSTQTFEIIIEISDAIHLDEDKNFIQNIYEKVFQKDNIWQLIPINNFARVTFEKNLTNNNDITIYAKPEANQTAKVEVYEKDSSIKLAEFEEITEEGFYKILLENLASPQNTFDLLVKQGAVFFDLIIDPFIQYHFTGVEADATAPWDGWIDGGSDCARDSSRSYCTDATCAGGGSWSIEIKDDATGSYTQQTFDLSTICAGGPCEYVTLSFWAFYETTIDNGEELDVMCDGTTIWSCYPNANNDPADDSADCAGAGIENNWRFHEINLSNPEFGSCTIDNSVTLRFESEYSGNNEDSWIDGMNITGFIGNLPPEPTPEINSTDGTNHPSQNLNCFDTLTDQDADSMNVSIRWYKDSTLNLSTTHNGNYANGTFFNTILSATNTSNNENWMCSMQLTDGTANSSWVNSTSILISDIFVDYSPLTCDDIWGNCGSGEPDNTFDSCANNAGTDERIEDIYLNSTAIKFGDTIQVICEYYTTETTGDEIYVYYRNSSTATWVQQAAGSSSGTASTIRNWTAVNITPDSVVGEHQVRCIIDFDGENDECASGSYFDNDDVNFSVAADSNVPTTPTPEINSTDGTNKPSQDLNCFDWVSDPNGDDMNVTTRWYRNGVLNLTSSYLNNYASGSFFNAILSSSNTTHGENWMCSMQLTDGSETSPWANSSSLLVSAIFVDYSPLTCDDIWGNCGTGEPDNTFDSCANSGGADERIEDIYLNSTAIKFGDTIQVICQYYSTETTADELYVYYRNSSTATWVQQAAGSSSAPGSTIRNWTAVNITPDLVEGEHQIRCIIDYDGENDECASGSWFDNDDVNFTVASNSTYPTTPTPEINSTDGTNNPNQNLNCFDTILDPTDDPMNVTVRWYRDSTLELTSDYNNSYASGTDFNAILLAQNTSESEDWMCSMRLFDGAGYSSWANSSSLFVTSVFTNYSSQTCSGFWGNDCGEDPESFDNTWDTCAYDDANSDELVQEMYLNSSTVMAGDTLELICTFEVWNTDNVYMWYYNGTGWTKIYENINLQGYAAGETVNFSTTFTANSSSGTHWVRCGINYNDDTETDECTDGSGYFDNDDLAFNVSLPLTPPTTPTPEINSTDGTNLTLSGLNCFDNLSDANGDSMNVTVRWYKNQTLNQTHYYNNSYADGSFFNAVLDSSNLSGADVWNCSLQVSDGYFSTPWANSSSISIIDPGLPPQITIIHPESQTYTSRTQYINISTNKNTSSCFYSDNAAANQSLTKINDTFFSEETNFTDGSHNLTIYCNDTYNQWNSTEISFLISLPKYKPIAEFGKTTDLQSGWSTISFNNTFDEVPIVVHRVDYNYDYDALPCQTRIRNVDETGFQIRAEAWSLTACPGTGVDATWLAMEPGTHNISNEGTPARQVEATSIELDYNECMSGGSGWNEPANRRQLQASWSAQPLILASVQTANDLDVITHYIKGCGSSSTTWNETCVEIGMSGMENDGAYQPCTLHTSNETAGYIAWEMDSDWAGSETLDNSGTSASADTNYSWEAYWESDSVAGSANDAYPMSSYYVTLSQSYTQGTAFASGIRIDGGDGLFPAMHFSAPSNQVYFLADEDRYGDTDQSHTAEPFELLFFSSNSGFLYSDEEVEPIEIISPLNNSMHATSNIDFIVKLNVAGDSCYYTLDETTNQTLTKINESYFTYTQNGISDGTHNATFFCNDTLGTNYQTEKTFFEIGTKSLGITSVTPTPASYFTPYLDLNVTTNETAEACIYSLDGAANQSITKLNDTHFSLPNQIFSGGEHTISIYCNDSFGHEATTNTSFLVSITQYETIGEFGAVRDIEPETWTTVYFNNTFDEIPVVVHQIDYGYDYDDNPCTTRVRAITKTSFQIRTDSWSEADSCPSVGIDGYWLAMEKGIHNVSNDGTPVREVEVTNFTMDVDACGSGANPTDWTYAENHRLFQNSWSAQPLVLSAVQTANDADPISQYMRGCTTSNADTWNETCIEIGLNGMENDGTVRPCEIHTIDEEGGYIAWQMDSSWTDAETLDNSGASGDAVTKYHWEAYWESDNVQGSQNDPYPMSAWYITLNQTYDAGIALGSGIRVDGANGVFPTVHYDAPSNQVFLLSDEDMFGDSEQSHTPEPYELLFFNATSGFLYSENTLNFLTVHAPINNTVYSSPSILFNISSLIDSDSCWYSLNGGSNQTMTEDNPKNFYYTQGGLSDTNHSVIFYCNDTYGGEYTSENYTFSVDSSPLNLTAILPLPQTYNVTNQTFEVSTSKPVSWCSYTLNGGSNQTMTSVNSTYFEANKSDMRVGTYDLIYYCGQGVGGVNSTSLTFSIDLSVTEKITNGSATISSGSSEVNVSFTPQAKTKSLLLFSVRSSSSAPSQIQVLGELQDDQINFRRYSTTGTTYIEWQVIESPDLYVQRRSQDFTTSETSSSHTIEEINTTETFTTISGRLDSSTTSENTESFWSARLPTSTSLEISRGASGTLGETHWQVAEWDGSFVQSSYLTTSGTGTTTPLSTSVNTSRAFLIFSREISGETALDENMIRGSMTSDNVTFSRAGTSSSEFRVSWYAVENPRFTVQSGSTTVSGSSPVNQAITTIPLNESFMTSSHTSTGGGTTYANAFITNKILDETTIQFQKGTGSQTNIADWFVIALGEAPINFLNVISPLPQTYSTTTIDFNVSLGANGSWCGYSLDEGANQTMTMLNDTYFYYMQAGLSSTTHNVTFYCNDTSGSMTKSSMIFFEVDLSAPTVTSLSPPNQTTNYTNTLYFSYNTTDNRAISSCSLIADEQIIWTDTSITMDTTQFFEAYLDNGVYTWYINCSDDGGLTGSSEKRIINVSGQDTYNWTGRFWETSTDNHTSQADISLANERDSEENTVNMTLPASSLTTVTIAKSQFLGNGGATIPASTIVDFSGYTTVERNNVGYITWKVYIENATGDFLICQSGDDSTSGTRMSSPSATWLGTCTTPAYELLLKNSDRIKMVMNIYNSDSSTLDFTHSWDDLRLSFVDFMNFNPLGALSVDISYPTLDIDVDRYELFNVTCEASCTVGNCPNTQVYLEDYNGTDWNYVDSSGVLVLGPSESNPHSLGTVSSAEYTNFTIQGNLVGTNDVRCSATSTYSSDTGSTTRQIEVLDTNLAPGVNLTSPATNYFTNQSSITLDYFVYDENDNIANSTLILNGLANETNSSEVRNNRSNSFTITLPDGTYNWTVNVTDSESLTTEASPTRTFTIDTSPPTISLHNPTPDQALTSASVFFNFTASDTTSANLTCDLTVDSTIIEPSFQATSGTPINFTKVVGIGSHLWNVSCRDDAGNINTSETRNFTVTDNPPVLTQITPDQTWFNTSTPTFEYNITDNGVIQNCSLFINGAFNQSNQTPVVQNSTLNFTLNSSPDGEYNWSASCIDEALLESTRTNRTFYIDTQNPVVSANLPTDLTISPTSTINFNFTATDNLDDDMYCYITINSNSSISSGMAPNNTLTNFQIQDLSDGAQVWNVTCVDNANNTGTSTTRTVTVEEYPTVVLNTPDNSWFYPDLELYFTPDDNAEMANCTLIINQAANKTNQTPITLGSQNLFSIDDFPDGQYNWSVNCTDTYGLTSSPGETRTAYRDGTPPTINLSTPVNGEEIYSAGIEFNFTTTDTMSPIMTCNITVDGTVEDSGLPATNNTLTNRTVSVSPGTHFWNITCWDQAGNTNTSETRNFTNYEAPGVTLDQPDNNTWSNQSAQTLTYSVLDSDDTIANCSLYIDGAFDQSNSTPVSNGEINNFTKTFSEGPHTWNVICIDYTLLQGSGATRTINIDTTPPIPQAFNPLENETLDWNNVTFNFTATDNLDDTLNCTLTVDSFPEITDISLQNNTQATEYVMRNDGLYEWQLECTDEAGNTNSTPIRNFTVNAPPRVTLNDPPNNNFTTLADITFNYTPEDAYGLTWCRIFLDGQLNQTDNSIDANVPNTFTITGISEGPHNWTVECLDSESNSYAPEPINLTRDITPPQINLTAPADNAILDSNSDVLFNWTPTDTLDILLSCDLVIDGTIEDTSFATSGFPRTELVSGLSLGPHYWNVTCRDQAGNSNTSQTWTFNYTNPDYLLNETSISISNENPTENETLWINATVYELGGISSTVEVKFYNGDPETTGTQIGTTQTLFVEALSSNTTSIQWNAPLGTTNIYAIVDFPDLVTELNETNNKANKTISVESWHFFYGSISQNTNFTLEDSTGYEVEAWNMANATDANIYVADYDASIDWLSIHAIGKTTSGSASSNDIQEIDTALNMTIFKDSHEVLYLNASSQINETRNYTVFSRLISEVPVTTSINSTNFKTGILWDTSDSSDSEYNESEKEDLIYVTKVNKGQAGSYETTDYELRVPANLRNYDPTNSQSAAFYLELL